MSENIYHTEKYRIKREKFLRFISPEYYRNSETKNLGNGYTLTADKYSEKIGSDIYAAARLHLKKDGAEIYTFDDIGWHAISFSFILNHSDGKEYFIFREELCGFSVLRIEDMKSMHFVPDTKSENDRFFFYNEPFYYDPETDIAAAHGSRGYSVNTDIAVIDLGDPLKEPDRIVTFLPMIDPDGDAFSDLKFKRFEPGGRLIISAETASGTEELAFGSNDLRRFLRACPPEIRL